MCVCVSVVARCLVLCAVVACGRCSFRCIGRGREKCLWILLKVSTWSLCVAAICVRNGTQIL
jgi:hypothetical protein